MGEIYFFCEKTKILKKLIFWKNIRIFSLIRQVLRQPPERAAPVPERTLRTGRRVSGRHLALSRPAEHCNFNICFGLTNNYNRQLINW